MIKISLKEANDLFRQFQNIFHSLSNENNFYYNCESIDTKHTMFNEIGNATVINANFSEISFYLHKSYQSINGIYSEIPYLSLRIIIDNEIIWELELKLEKDCNKLVYVAKTTSLDIPSLESLFILTDSDLIKSRNEEIRRTLIIIKANYAKSQYKSDMR